MSSGVIVSTVVTRSTYVFSHLELVLMQSEANKMKFDGHYSKDYRRQVRCYISKLLQDYIHSRSGCALAIERDMGTVWRHIRDMLNKKTNKNYSLQMVRAFYYKPTNRETRSQKELLKLRRLGNFN